MEAIREIREIDSDKLLIDIPARSRKRKVEIIVLPIDEIRTGQPGRFSNFFKNPVKIENFRMPSREERNARYSQEVIPFF